MKTLGNLTNESRSHRQVKRVGRGPGSERVKHADVEKKEQALVQATKDDGVMKGVNSECS